MSGLQAADGPSVQIGLRSGTRLAILRATAESVSRKLVVLELETMHKVLGKALDADLMTSLAFGRPDGGASDGAEPSDGGRVAGKRARSPEPTLLPVPRCPNVLASACVP